MFWNIVKFEIDYRRKRPATYIFFVILFLMPFLALVWDNLTVGGGTGQIKENAPTVLANIMLICSVLPGFFLMSGLMGVPVVRDRNHLTESMIYTTSVNKRDYLFGRFVGSLIVTLFVFLGLLFGLMAGAWVEAGNEDFLPFQAWHYIQPFLVFVIPNVLFGSALFFMGGALSKNLLFVYMQGVLLLVLYLAAGGMLGEDLENRELVALLDPFALNTREVLSQYWTIAEQNSLVYPLSGILLFNRLLWLAVGIGALAATYLGFKFQVVRTARRSKKKTIAPAPLTEAPASLSLESTAVEISESLKTRWQQLWSLARLYFQEIVKSVPFIAIAAAGMVIMGINAIYFNEMYGTPVYASTGLVLGLLSDFNIFFVIIIVFYAGELIWRERDVKLYQIVDATPVPNAISLLGKFLGFTLVHVVLLLILILAGVLIQLSKGYFEIDLALYFRYMFSETFFFLLLYTGLAFFFHTLVNHKFVGHALIILFFIINVFVINQMGLEHAMFRFGSGGLGAFSDMNAYGHYVNPFNWLQLYWFGLVAIFFIVSVLFSMRGTDILMKTRLKLAGLRYSRPVILFSMAALLVFAGSGCFVFYNTNVLNTYRNSDESEELRARYEKELKKYQDLPQPIIVETKLKVDLYPSQRDFLADGYYILKNDKATPIQDIHIQLSNQASLELQELSFAGGAGIKEDLKDYRYLIYELDQPLNPGDSIRMDFRINYDTRGFVESNPNNDIVFNGTFFNSTYFPGLGYNEGAELTADDDRKDNDLPERERMRDQSDSVGLHTNLFGDDAHYIRFEIAISTDSDQIAIAPGYLQREWEEDGRRHFHYKMDQPMVNFYNILSARYEVMKEDWNGISLEIYYHKDHAYNLDRMMRGMKESLADYSETFRPYQYRQMRIIEFPRYASFAQSFANTVPFSEAIGFVQEIGEEDVDMVFYVTAHEMAHQWWGHQVTDADVKGNAMLSETLSQYSALMVMKKNYSPEMIQKFLKYELDRYLRGRAGESKKEQPLLYVEGQGYIHYRKGSLVMYALQDYISEDSIDLALRRFNEDWAYGKQGRYPTSRDLLGYFQAVTPDSFQYLYEDLFETITLFENRTREATYTDLGDGRYQVHLEAEAIKYRADSLGNESPIAIKDWIDVGVFGQTESGKDTLLYLQKHKITGQEVKLDITVDQLPTKAGIDPINKLIDRNPDDNVKTLSENRKM
jgi:ABC-2 type transport system permease protein